MEFSRDNAMKMLMKLLEAKSEPDCDKSQVIEVMTSMLENLGMKVTRHENDGAPALYAVHGTPTIMFSGHLDTVNLGTGWTKEQGQIEGDRIYGRGVLDMKGPCVSILLAASKIIETGQGIALTFTTDEEVSMAGAEVLAREHPEINEIPLIVVAEPTDMVPVTEEKGVLQVKVLAEGKSAHASMTETGDSAINKLLASLERLKSSDFFGETSEEPITFNISMISGGELINMVASKAEASIDIRYSPDFTKYDVYDKLEQTMSPDGQLVFEILHKIPEIKSRISSDLMAIIKNEFSKAGKVPYATEMAIFGQTNPNVILFGPGYPKPAHQPDEWIEIDAISNGASAFIRLAELVNERLQS